MLFRQIVLFALLAGAVTGLLVTGVQHWQVIPIIQAAERIESGGSPEGAAGHEHADQEAAGAQDHGGDEHAHAGGAWAPEGGIERTAFTLLSNVLAGIGFGLILLAGMVGAVRFGLTEKIDWRWGLLWGAAGYAAFFLAPALGVPPKVPGTAAAALELRQWWWLLAAGCTAAGLAGLAFARHPWRWFAPLLLVVPYIVGAPQGPSEPFRGYPPATVAELEALTREFIVATGITNAVMWLVLGAITGWAAARIVKSSNQPIGDDPNEFAK